MNAMLVNSHSPTYLCSEVTLSAFIFKSRIPHKKSSKSSFKLWKGYPPNVKCESILCSDPSKRKLRSKTSDGIFIRYVDHSATHRFFYWKVMLDYNKMKQNLQSFLKILFLRVEKASSSPLVSTISENDISRNDTLELRSKRQIKEFSFEKWILHIHCCWGTIKLHWSNFFSLQWVLKKRHSTWKCFFFSK